MDFGMAVAANVTYTAYSYHAISQDAGWNGLSVREMLQDGAEATRNGYDRITTHKGLTILRNHTDALVRDLETGIKFTLRPKDSDRILSNDESAELFALVNVKAALEERIAHGRQIENHHLREIGIFNSPQAGEFLPVETAIEAARTNGKSLYEAYNTALTNTSLDQEQLDELHAVAKELGLVDVDIFSSPGLRPAYGGASIEELMRPLVTHRDSILDRDMGAIVRTAATRMRADDSGLVDISVETFLLPGDIMGLTLLGKSLVKTSYKILRSTAVRGAKKVAATPTAQKFAHSIAARFKGLLDNSAGKLAPERVSLDADSLAALRATGLDDTAIQHHVDVLGDIYLFRGSTEAFAGNPVLQKLGISPTSIDPVVATTFAAEGAARGANPVVMFGRRADFVESLGMGNVRSVLEREVTVALLPQRLAELAPHSIPLSRARTILKEMGIEVPATFSSSGKATEFLESAPRMTVEQVHEFIQKASVQ